MTQIPTQCTACGEALDPAEQEAPRTGDDPYVLCDDCYAERYDYTCCWCKETDDRQEQHRYVVVWDADAVALALPGVYRVERVPYYRQPLVGPGWLHASALTWLGYLPACPPSAPGSACGHLCAGCQGRAVAESLYATRCGVAALRSWSD